MSLLLPLQSGVRKLNIVESTLVHWRARLRSKPDVSEKLNGSSEWCHCCNVIVCLSVCVSVQTQLKQVALRKPRQRLKVESNWPMFYYQ